MSNVKPEIAEAFVLGFLSGADPETYQTEAMVKLEGDVMGIFYTASQIGQFYKMRMPAGNIVQNQLRLVADCLGLRVTQQPTPSFKAGDVVVVERVINDGYHGYWPWLRGRTGVVVDSRADEVSVLLDPEVGKEDKEPQKYIFLADELALQKTI